MKLFLSPTPTIDPSQKSITGVERVIIEQRRYLIDYLEFTDSPLDADVLAAHVVPFADTLPDILHCHGLYPSGEFPLPAWMWRSNRNIIDTIRKVKRITVPSPWIAEIFVRDMGFAPIIVPHGIRLEEWPEPSTAREMDVIFNKNRVDAVCTPEPMQQLAVLCPDMKFISTFGVPSSKNLDIVGLQPYDRMQEILYKSGIYFAPTKETYGIGILEAMAAGMVTLAWNWGNAPELIVHKKTGYLAKPGDYEDTVKGLRYCIDNFDKLSKAARQEALKHDWKDIIPKYVEVYESALEKHQGPQVSVIIPCYNYADFVADAIRSVKSQTFLDWECLVVDDGSEDDSLVEINKAVNNNPKFKVLVQSNRGVASARNRGAMEAKGEFLCFLDADDTLKERFMETLLPPLLEDRSIGISFGSLELHTPRGPVAGSWPNGFNFDAQLKKQNQVPSCNLLRRDAFFRAGGYKNHFTLGEDAELWTNIGLAGFSAIHTTQTPVMIYRVHENSITNKARKEKVKEPNWLDFIPAANGGPQPFASIATPEHYSHPVFSYDQPLVSIIIPVGDGHEAILENAIESVKAQTDGRWELIVVDDTKFGKIKNCGILPYSVRYPLINWKRKRKYGNVSAARNLGANSAKGRFLLFLDADDELDKHFLRQTLKVAAVRPKSIIYTDWISLPEGKVHHAEEWNFERLKNQALFVVTFLHPKEAFDEVGGFNEEIPVWEDWDYTVQLAHKGYHGIRVPEPLFSYHYESGKRREECLDNAEELMKGFRQRYLTLEALPPKELGLVILSEDPLIKKSIKKDEAMATKALIKYTGDNMGARTFRTPLGNRYRFDGRSQRQSWVPIKDVHFFERMLDFQVVETQ